ncbi:MAG: hypothetical protein WCA35_21120 [Kovacikia sp.]
MPKQTSLKLADYPEAIALLQGQILRLDQELTRLNESLAVYAVEIEKQVLADASLSNDAKRKAARLNFQQLDPDYSGTAIKLKTTQVSRDSLQIELDLLRNQFQVEKLQLRYVIAQMESAVAA